MPSVHTVMSSPKSVQPTSCSSPPSKTGFSADAGDVDVDSRVFHFSYLLIAEERNHGRCIPMFCRAQIQNRPDFYVIPVFSSSAFPIVPPEGRTVNEKPSKKDCPTWDNPFSCDSISRSTASADPRRPCRDGLRPGPFRARCRGWRPDPAPWPFWPARSCPWSRRFRLPHGRSDSPWWTR